MTTPTPVITSPLRLFLSDLLVDATMIPEIVVDNARTTAPLPIRCMASSTSSNGMNHISQHSVHRWDTLDVSPTVSKNTRKKHTTTTPSSFTSTSSSSTSSSTVSISSTKTVVCGTTSASSAPIGPPGRSSVVRGLPPKPSTKPSTLRRDAPMLSSSAIPLVPVRHPSEEPSIASGGSSDSLRSFRYSSHQSRNLVQPPFGNNSNNKKVVSGGGTRGTNISSSSNNSSKTNVANYQEPYSPIRTLSPQQQLTRKLSATFSMLADATQSSPILSPVRRLSRTLGIHHRQGGTTLSTVSSQPPTLPIRKPSKSSDGTLLSPQYLPAPKKAVNIEEVQQLQRRTSSILSNGSSSSSGSATSKGSVNIQPPKRRMSSSHSGTTTNGSGSGHLHFPTTGPPSALTRKASVIYGSTVSTTSKQQQQSQQQEFTIIPEDNSIPPAPVVAMPSPPRTRTSPMSNIFQRGGTKSSRR